MRIISRAEWGAVHRNGFGTRSLGHLDKILHHTAGPVGDDEGATMRLLERTGQARFSGGISYNLLFFPSGNIYEGVGVDRIGAHTTGHNTTGLSYCLVGNYQNLEMTPQQDASLAWALNYGVQNRWHRLNTITWAHRQLKATACPGEKAFSRIGLINALANNPGTVVIPVTNPIPPVKPVRPPVVLLPRRNVVQTLATQRAVRVKADTWWGQDTETAVNSIRGALNNNFPWGVHYAQNRVGTRPDGSWGPRSRASLKETVKALQRAWGVSDDGSWGPLTEAAWVAARSRNFNNW